MASRVESTTQLSHTEIDAKLRALKTDLETAHGAERKVLEDRIKTLENHIQAEKEAKESKEKNEGTGGTLVLPPEQVQQGQEHGQRAGDKPAGHQDSSGEGKKGRGWKKIW